MNKQEWKSGFVPDEIHEVMEAEAGRFGNCATVQHAARVIPPGFQVETVPEETAVVAES